MTQTEGHEARKMTHEGIAHEFGLPVDRRTITRYKHILGYYFRIAQQVLYADPKTCELRLKFAREMLRKYRTKADWHPVRFSDESHQGLDPQGKKHIWRLDGE